MSDTLAACRFTIRRTRRSTGYGVFVLFLSSCALTLTACVSVEGIGGCPFCGPVFFHRKLRNKLCDVI